MFDEGKLKELLDSFNPRPGKATENPPESVDGGEVKLADWNPPVLEDSSQLKTRVAELESAMAADLEQRTLASETMALDKALDRILAVAEIDREKLRHRLIGEFVTNGEFAAAFDARDAAPEKWGEVVDTFAADFPRKKTPDLADRTGAHVRGAREAMPATSGFDSIDWGSLSQQEFETKSAAFFKSLSTNRSSFRTTPS